MTARKKAREGNDLKVLYEYEESEDGQGRLEKIFEFLLEYGGDYADKRIY
jgi:hypothetical protein